MECEIRSEMEMNRETNLDCAKRFVRFAICILLGAALANTAVLARKNARVLVDSYAREGYEEGKVVDGEARFESYHFFKGRHFGGNIRDKSLREVPFEEVVQTLAMEMRTRNYYPEPVMEKGEFLIVVHWGVTGIEEPFDELFLNEPGDAGFGAPDVMFDSQDSGGSQDFSQDFSDDFQSYDAAGPSRADKNNAALIGFDRALRRRGLMPQDEYELRSMLQDERYFIILMAYDWQKLRLEKEYELVWSTRFSLDAIGTNFKEAHFALSRGAANYIGTNLGGKLSKTKTHLGPGDIEFGEIEVIETLEETDTEK